MQKGLYRHYVIHFIHSLSRLRRALPLILAVLLLAPNVHSQSRSDIKVTLRLDNADIKQSLLALQQKSGRRFSFGEQLVKGQLKKVAADFKETPLLTAVKEVLSGTNLSYRSMEDFIIIEEKPAPKPASISPNAAAGQGQGTGGLKGRVVEFETSQPLPGASVQILELNRGITTDSSGYYRFTGIKAGRYTLKVSFVSYTTENQSVDVKANREETYDIKLQGNNQLAEVLVTTTGKMRRPVAHTSEKQVLDQIKQAAVVISGISSEQISKSADRNAAEAVQKVAGVTVVDDKFVVVRGMNQRYNLTYLNDNIAPSTEVYSRAFALDLIPSRIIDRIMVYKSPAPENLADATGGVVKIFTKDAKNIKHFDIEFQLGYRHGTTFNKNFLTYQGGKFDFLGFDDGTRKLPASVPGYDQLALAKLSPSAYARAFNSTLSYQRMMALPNMQLTANYYNSFRLFGKNLSSLTSLSYKNELQKMSIYRQQGYPAVSFQTSDRINQDDRNTQTAQVNLLQNFTFRLRDSSVISFKNFLFQQGVINTISRLSYATIGTKDITSGNAYNKDNILSYNQRFLYAGNFGGNHYFNKNGKQQLKWNAGYTYSLQSTPDQRVVRLTTSSSYAAIGDTVLQWRSRGIIGGLSDDNYTIPRKLGMISRLWMRNSEGNYNGSIDYTYHLKPWVSLRAGIFHQWKERRLYRRVYTVHEGDLTDLTSNMFPGQNGYLNPQLVRFHEQDLAKVWSSDYLRDDHTGLQVFDRTTGSDSYLGTEQNNSAYAALMLIPPGSKVDIYTGLRYEYNRQQIGAAIPASSSSPGAINYPIYINNPMKTWLPSVNVAWRPSQSWVVRAAYGKTVNRTEFREVAPYKELDYESNVIIEGNTKLKSATINNYDFRVEFYPAKNRNGEMISAGVFYKNILNPIERINTSLRTSDADFPTFSFQNAASATVKGIEVEVNKRLDFVPLNAFRYLSVIGNVSIMKSVTKNDTTSLGSLSFTTDERLLQGQAPYIVNIGLYYENPGLGSKLAVIYNTTGTNIYAAGRGYRYNDFTRGATYRGSILELPRHTLDLSLTQRIVKSLQLKFSVQNLLDQEIKMAEDFNFTNKYEPLRNEPGDDVNANGDNITQRYKSGRYFLLNLSYSF